MHLVIPRIPTVVLDHSRNLVDATLARDEVSSLPSSRTLAVMVMLTAGSAVAEHDPERFEASVDQLYRWILNPGRDDLLAAGAAYRKESLIAV